jgi:hypothetical protein
MTWTRLPDTFGDDPALLQLPRGLRLLYVEALCWSAKQETDGRLPAYVVARITDEPDPLAGMAELVRVDLVQELADGGWLLTRFEDEQISAEEMSVRRNLAAKRQQRRRRHVAGDHSQCDPRYCKHALLTRSSRVTNA